jgi:hypothetical protein
LSDLQDKKEASKNTGFAGKISELRNEFGLLPAIILAEHSGCAFFPISAESGEFRFDFFGKPIIVTYPDGIIFSDKREAISEFQQLMLFYYFLTADGVEPTGKFISFADLPDGRIYAVAYQGYTGHELVQCFGENIEAIKSACEAQMGRPIQLADAAFNFLVFPKITIQLVYWLGDEDFPSSCQILFEARARHYLPIDACAMLGSMLTKKLIKSYQVEKNEGNISLFDFK